MPHRTGRVVRTVALVVSLATLAGCGARWTDRQQAIIDRSLTGGNSSGGAIDTGTGALDSSTGSGASESVGGGSGGAAGGTATGGSKSSQQKGGAAALPCDAPSKETGVADDTLTLGAISTQRGPVPGLGATMAAGARAYVEYQNSIGGICGRKIVLKQGDDAFDNGQNRAVVTELSKQVLGFAGSFGLADAGGAQVIADGNIPYTGATGSKAIRAVPSVFDTRPPYADPRKPIAKYDWLYQQGARKAALVYTAADAARIQMQERERPQIEASGMTIATVQEVPLSTLSYDSTARAVANSGADYMLFISDATNDASMARSMANTGYKLKFAEYVTGYGSNYIELAGAAAEGTTSWIPNLPDEDGNTTPGQTLYHKWFAYVAPDLRPDIFSAAAWAAVEAFMMSLRSLKGPITRDAVNDGLRAIGKFDAGGLLGPVSFGAQQNLGCQIAMQVKDGKWVRLHPAKGFIC